MYITVKLCDDSRSQNKRSELTNRQRGKEATMNSIIDLLNMVFLREDSLLYTHIFIYIIFILYILSLFYELTKISDIKYY